MANAFGNVVSFEFRVPTFALERYREKFVISSERQARNSKLMHIGSILDGVPDSLKMKSEKISELTTNRLSVYLRCLNTLASAGIKSISSQALAEQFNLNSAQIRKDLGYFGEFCVRGLGYHVEDLRQHITKILRLDKLHSDWIV